MAGTLDFLWNGTAPPSTTTYGSSTTGIPQFLSDYTQGLLAKSNAVASEPYPLYTAARISPFSADQNTAFQMTRDSAGSWAPMFNAGAGAVGTAAGQSPFAAGQPYLGAAGNVNAMGMAMPWMSAAGTAAPSAVASYMSPYQDQVVNRIGELAGRNLRENLMPAIGDQFIRAGQYGSSRMQEAVGRGLRDTQESALAAQGSLLNQGYGQAMSAFQNDASRFAGIGQTLGNLANTQQGNLANIGQVSGNLTSMGQKNLIDAGTSLGNMANNLQGLNLRDAAALEGVGQTQQMQDQKNLDLAYQDFLQQRDYPKTQLNFLSSMLRGIPYGTTTSTTATGPANAYGPSPLAQLASAFSLYGALNKAEGGQVKEPRYKSEFRIEDFPGANIGTPEPYSGPGAEYREGDVSRGTSMDDAVKALRTRRKYADGGRIRSEAPEFERARREEEAGYRAMSATGKSGVDASYDRDYQDGLDRVRSGEAGRRRTGNYPGPGMPPSPPARAYSTYAKGGKVRNAAPPPVRPMPPTARMPQPSPLAALSRG